VRKRHWLAGVAVVAVALFGTAGIASAQETTTPTFSSKEAKECYEKLAKNGTIDDCQKAPNPLLPATNEVIWGSLAFLVLLGVMWKFGMPAVQNMMREREQRIRNDLERAESAKSESEVVLEQYRAQLADARSEASRIIEESRQAADQMRRDLIARAEADAAELRARAQQDIDLATQRATQELQSRVADLAINLAETIVEHNLDRDTQLQLVENYINQVGNGQR
jgi:F-type H+-transporting ATPase subunit b